tara:strand:+ start:1175 stop:1582 length:408 start_codon:yes stop_codon:yes gene_type:complete
MQLITRGTNSTIIFTLKEKQTLTNPYFLFELRFRGDGTTVKTFVASDSSTYTDRYNQFLVTEVNDGSEILTSGTVNLQNVGEWHYRIFEQTSSSNLDVVNATSEIENGIIKVLTGTSSTSYTHQISDNSYTYNPS